MVDKVTDNDRANLKLAYDIASQKINSQNDANRSIDAKVGILFGFTGAISVGVLGVIIGNKELLGQNVFSTGVFVLMASIVFSVFAARSRTFQDPVDFSTVYSEQALGKDNSDQLNQVTADIIDTHVKNQKIVTAKSYLFDVSVFSLGIAIILLFIGSMSLI